MDARRQLRVGCEFRYTAAVDTPAVFQVVPLDTGPAVVRTATWATDPDLPRHGYTDLYGNPCQRLTLPAGPSTLRFDALVSVPDATEEVAADAPETPVTDLPDEVLVYTMPSRYVLPDVLGDEAWSTFGPTPPGYGRVQAVLDHVHDRLELRAGQQHAADHRRRRLGGEARGLPRLRARRAELPARAQHPGPVRLRLPARPGRPAGPGADGLRRLDRGLAGRPLVHLRPAQQRPPQGPGAHRPRPGRAGRRDGHHVRRPGAGADGGLGRGGARRDRLAGPAVARARLGRPRRRRVGHLPAAPGLPLLLRRAGVRAAAAAGRAAPGAARQPAPAGTGTSASRPTVGDAGAAGAVTHRDADGNEVVAVELPVVASAVEFTLAALVERVGPAADVLLPAAALADPRLLVPTRLTSPSPELWDLAESLRAAHRSDAVVGRGAVPRLRSELTFAFDATTVATTAAEAYALRRGVCQDIAHVMLTVCRLAGIPARYVSGHLLGEQGGSHAWVEVLVPDGPGARALGVRPDQRLPGRRPAPAGRRGSGLRRRRPHLRRLHRLRPRPLTWTKRAGITAASDGPAPPDGRRVR